MKKIKTVEEAIEFAIEREKATFTLYNDLAEKTQNDHSRDVIEGFAAEELAHQRKLEILRAHTKAVKIALKKTTYNKPLTIDGPGEAVEPDVNMDLKKALLFAMYLERKAESLYLHLANSCQDHDLQVFFKILTEEEILHYKRFQSIYNETFCQPEPVAQSVVQPVEEPEPEPVDPPVSKERAFDWVDLNPDSIY